MMQGTLTKSIVCLGLMLTVALCGAYLLYPSILKPLDRRIGDAVLAGAGPRTTSGAVVVVDVDETTLAGHGQWPWPRDQLALLLQKTEELGAACVVLDMILSEPDRTSPSQGPTDGAEDPESLPDNDAILAQALSRGPFVLGYEFLFDEAGRAREAPHLHPLKVVRVIKSGSGDEADHFFTALDVVCNLPRFSQAVRHSGFLNATPDSDGVLRRIPLLIQYQGRLYPGLALAALLKASNTEQVTLRTEENGQQYLVLDDTSIPLSEQGNIRMNFASGKGLVRRVSADVVLDGRVPAGDFEGCIVFIGTSASGLTEIHHAPACPILYPLDIHAQVVDTILTGSFVRRNREMVLWEAALALLIAALSGLLLARIGAMWNAAIGGLCLFGVWQGSGLVFARSGVLFSPMLPAMAVVLNFFILTIFKNWYQQNRARAETVEALDLLKVSENKLNSIVKTIPDIVYRLDAEGRITFISAAVARYGSSPDELVGRHVMDLVLPPDRPTAKYRINERRAGDRATSGFELRLWFSQFPAQDTSEVHHFSISSQGLYSEDDPTGLCFIGTQGIARDITEQKQLEQQLVQAQKMEAVGTLVNGIAHDFNNILQAITGFASLGLEERASGVESEYLGEIEAASKKGAALVRQLQTFSRKVEPELQVMDVNQLVIRSSRMLERMIPKMIALHTRLEEDLILIHGDPNQLEQVLLNLGTNARDAMPDGGSITFETRNLSVPDSVQQGDSGPGPGDWVQLTVADTGCGMSPEDQERIFDPFFTTKDVGQGTGLGLSTVFGIVSHHGGSINCQSSPGEGTTFTLLLPAESGEDLSDIVDGEAQQGREPRRGKETILLVDDEDAVRRGVGKGLERYGYKVRMARTGEEACYIYQQGQSSIQLVLLDLGMPGMGGRKCLETLKELDPDLPVVVATGYIQPSLKSEILDAGAAGFINKPYHVDEMLHTIGDILDADKA